MCGILHRSLTLSALASGHRARRLPMPTPPAVTPSSRSSCAGKARCTASSPSSTWQVTSVGRTPRAPTARLAWRGPRSTRACLHWRYYDRSTALLYIGLVHLVSWILLIVYKHKMVVYTGCLHKFYGVWLWSICAFSFAGEGREMLYIFRPK